MHVLLPTDGSELSITAARTGTTLLGRPEKVTLLTVITEVPGEDAGGFEGSVFSAEAMDAQWDAEMAEAGAELSRTAEALSGAEVAKRVEVGDVPEERLPEPVERAAYAVVAGAIEAGGDHITVGIRRDGAELTMVVDGVRSLPVRLADRVGALGGQIALGDASLTAVIPCG